MSTRLNGLAGTPSPVDDRLASPYIAWEIQPTCNMGCPFCYSSSYNLHRKRRQSTVPTPSQIDEGLGVLLSAGTSTRFVNWSGGEPLLRYKELPTIFAASRRRGCSNILSTNGMFSAIAGLSGGRTARADASRFRTYLETEIGPLLDWLAVSLDSADPAVNNDLMRLAPSRLSGSPRHYADVTAIVELYRETPLSFQLKINTLVTRKNVDAGVLEIGEMLKGIQCVWKLVQFNPRECPPELRRDFEVGTDEFCRLHDAVVERYVGRGGYEQLTVSTRLYDGSSEPYCLLVINTSGQVLVPCGEDHLVIASLWHNSGLVTPEMLATGLRTGIERLLSPTDVYRKHSRHGELSALDVFRVRNEAMLRTSYPDAVRGFQRAQ